ncbi:HAD superfamily hydrolase (TIGR01509 family) [Panacagrimonas perspica]|uniref:HAD superfamily hydrolase (TIGR01509 family) n=1 Tax=Panacagrimonas perspica TaxID=381431 RepID=A0A4V3US41_9GAMM|nr:HAD-IA family hydrolase [Panacagrimonas perspica]TDU32380.1 HAD superfamily hydrolase (TIGR01509 family) [Panacagrimonas perspica]THD05311.1 haloacid dehalogenase [Panacagrimonas perspica]
MTLQALLLDVDGTVADTERHGHRPAYNRAFRKLGLGFRWGPKLYRKLLEQPGGKERLLHYVNHYKPELGLHAAAYAADPHAWVREVHALKSHYFQRYLRKGQVPLRPGVARLIREADAAGLRVALVSNASRASLKPVLRYGLGEELADRIDLIVSGEDVKRKKPAPDTYLLALAKLGLGARECVALEDSAMGLRAAVAAGVPTIVTTNANTEGDDFSSAIMVLDGCGEPDQPVRSARGSFDGPCLTLAQLQGFAESVRSAA